VHKAIQPDQVVIAYYDAINARDYPAAWALVGGTKFGQTYKEFAAGFADTVHHKLIITGVSSHTVTIELVVTQDNGGTRVYRGAYTIQGGRIVEANLQQARPTTPPSTSDSRPSPRPSPSG
jgi:hypothetical protein